MPMTASELATHYQVHLATIGRAIAKTNLPRLRGARYDAAQVAQIVAHLRAGNARWLSRLAALEAQIAQLQQENRAMQAALAEMQRQQEAHDHLLQTIIGWGKNTARIIRALWRRMPDYASGETPGEFPAITHIRG